MAESNLLGDLDVSGLSPTEIKALEVLAAGGTLKDLRGLDSNDIETVYAIGFNLYDQAKYDQAEPMFQFACLYGHTDPRYWMALGNCRQMAKKYQDAIDAYGFSYMMNIEDPWPSIQAALCFLAMQNKDLAREALDLAAKTIENNKPDAKASQRIQALRQAL